MSPWGDEDVTVCGHHGYQAMGTGNVIVDLSYQPQRVPTLVNLSISRHMFYC